MLELFYRFQTCRDYSKQLCTFQKAKQHYNQYQKVCMSISSITNFDFLILIIDLGML